MGRTKRVDGQSEWGRQRGELEWRMSNTEDKKEREYGEL